MDQSQLRKTRDFVNNELKSCISFWLTNGFDQSNGGIYTCLDRTGALYSTDKSVWMQGRAAYIFSLLYNTLEKREDWLNSAKSCIDFMEQHCINREAGGRMYFTVTAQGNPLRQRRYCFSEGFYAIANAEYGKAANDSEAIQRAREAYDLVYQLNHALIKDPTGLEPKTIPETRQGRALADPMIFLNMTSVLRRCDPENRSYYDERALECVDSIFRYHHKPELRCTLETVGLNGEFWEDISVGRVVNPGHDIECSWFLMEEANYQNNDSLRKKAIEVFDFAYERGWDQAYGGLLYFMDVLGKPPEAYEHDMKLWWPHNELLIASLMIYRDTKNEKYLTIFYQALEYCKKFFCDPQYGEWYGYLRRDGRPTEPACKGSTFKGPFHLPRMLLMVGQMIDQILADAE